MTEPMLFVFKSELMMPVIARLVVVACDVVAFSAVKFSKVVEPVRRRFESVERPPVAVSVPFRVVLPVVVAPPEMVRPPACVPEPMVEEAFTIIPRVVVGAR